MDDISTICRRAESLLEVVYREPIHLGVLEQFESSHTVLRCSIQSVDKQPYTPATVIIKQRAFDLPRKPNDFDQVILFKNEWASLDFLTSLSSSEKLGPRLITSDRQTGLVVLEDLGSAQSVQDVLYSTDQQAAVAALVGMGSTLGRLHGMTVRHESEFVGQQTGLGAATTICDANLDCRTRFGDLHALMEALNIPLSEEVDRAVNSLENTIHGPGDFRTFVHNDAGPHNLVIAAGQVLPLDFEFAGFGFGFIDLASARMGFPPSFRGRMLPKETVQQMEKAFRTELARFRPALDDSQFKSAMGLACVHWALSKFIGFSDYLVERFREGEIRDTGAGRDPKRIAFSRQQLYTYLQTGLTAVEETGEQPELRHLLSQIVDRILTVWPETLLLPGYPAFGGEPWHYP